MDGKPKQQYSDAQLVKRFLREKYPKEFNSWIGMRFRCKPNQPDKVRRRYYDRGITVCPLWENSFEEFLKDMGPCPEGVTLDRKDNDKGYFPGNCRWADDKTQANNREKKVKKKHSFNGHIIPQ